MLGVMALQHDLNLFNIFCVEVLTKEYCNFGSIDNCSEISVWVENKTITENFENLKMKKVLSK